ncbi:MAG: LytTR family DNA-binding domain-containing protein [Eubacteriales bacterium]
MLKIAIVDDEAKIRDSILDMLYEIEKTWGETFEMEVFDSGEELLSYLTSHSIHVILLDIQMKELDGIAVLKKIDELDEECFIIFISSFDKRRNETYDRNVLGFLDKPVDMDLLDQKLMRAKKLLEKEADKIFSYTVKGKTNYIQHTEIISIESKKHYVNICTKKGTYSYKDSLSNVWNQLSKSEMFCKPHRSYIVNIKYLEMSSKNSIITNNMKITIGKDFKSDTEMRILRYMKHI